MGDNKVKQPIMLEMISSNKYDDIFKNSIRDYYTYGFKNVEDFDASKQTVNKNWKLISRLLGDDWEFVKEKKTKQNHMDLKTEVNETTNPLNVLYQFRGKSSLGEYLNYLFMMDQKTKLNYGLTSLGISSQIKELKEYPKLVIGYKNDVDDISNLKDECNERRRKESLTTGIILNDIVDSSIVLNWLQCIEKDEQAGPIMINTQLNILLNKTKCNYIEDDYIKYKDKYIKYKDKYIKYKDKYKTLSTYTQALFANAVIGNLKYNVIKRNEYLDSLIGIDTLNDDQRACMYANDYWYKSPLTMKKIIGEDKVLARKISDMVDFFSNYYVLGELGYILKQRLKYILVEDENNYFRFKHNYIQRSLYDYNLSDLIDTQITQDSIDTCVLLYTHGTRGNKSKICMVPLQIRVSVTNGREYVIGYDVRNNKLISCRMEFIDRIVIGYIDESNKVISGPITPKKIKQKKFDEIYSQIEIACEMLPFIWGTDVSKCIVEEEWKKKLKTYTIELNYDKEKEDFILRRLKREIRMFSPQEIEMDKYSFTCFPTKELRSWIRSFYCRVNDNGSFDDRDFKLKDDVNSMYNIYNNDGVYRESERTISKKESGVKLPAPGGVCGHDKLFNELFSLYSIAVSNSIIKFSNLNAEENIEDIIRAEVIKTFKDFDNKCEETETVVDGIKEYLKESELIKITDEGVESRFITDAEDYLYDFLPITEIECRWIKTILNSPISELFITEREKQAIEKIIDENIPSRVDAFNSDKIYYFDRYIKEKSSYEEYINVKTIFEAMKNNKKVDVTYETRSNRKIRGKVNPAYIQYSVRNDMFQIWIYPDTTGKERLQKLNAINITDIKETDEAYDLKDIQTSVNKYVHNNEKKITIEFYEGKRNLPDRILTEFSIYKKRCERNKETGKYNVELYYDVEDEKEILIRLLSFGPYIKVTSDDKYNFICKEIRRRIKVQKGLLDKE